MPHLDRIHIAGFKSIRDQEVELRELNVLIGANGVGKTNFVGVFRLLNEIFNKNLQLYVARTGGANQLLHFGRKVSERISLRFEFDPNAYSCELVPTSEDSLIFANEKVSFRGPSYDEPFDSWLGSGHPETKLHKGLTPIASYVVKAFESWRIYHFHDTSESAKIKQFGSVDDNRTLRADAGNLAAFLLLLREKQEDIYNNIVDTVRMAAPFFEDFDLHPDRRNTNKIKLEWREKGSDSYFDASALSDGTLRFMSLATLLLQPEPPTTILLDEPELGLHPYAITLLAELLDAASKRTQLIVSTQSVTLVNQLKPEDIIVVDREESASTFSRLTQSEIASWLDDYALGELWEKNVIGGRPG